MDTKTMTTLKLYQCYPLKKKKWTIPWKILSFAAGASKFRITIDTELESFIIIHLHEGTMIIFKQCGTGLYYIDTTNKAFSENQTIDNTFLNTVDSNKLCFHRRETKGSDEARILQQLVGWPSAQTFKEAIQNNQIRNCPITTNDISRAEYIYGPRYLSYKARKSEGSHSTKRRSQGYLFPFLWPNTTVMWNYPWIIIFKWKHISYTQNQGRYILGQSKHATTE